MVARERKKPLIVIVGETGSGKTALAIRLARHFNGEIIAADSRTVYKGMNIGTAKPTPPELRQVHHYGIDVTLPDQPFTAYDFKRLAISAIADISKRGRVPFLVGGTGLYVDAVLYDFAFRPAPDNILRAQLTQLSVEVLQARVLAAGMALPENRRNPRHLMRLLESGPPTAQVKQMRPNTLVIGLRQPSDVLRERLEERAAAMITNGLVEEALRLQAKYGLVEALRAPAYQAALSCGGSQAPYQGLREAIVSRDLKLAKRQRTWFKRNACIHWLSNRDNFTQSVDLITTFLNK